MKLLGEISIFKFHTRNLKPHELGSFLSFYLDKKIDPILASGGYPGDYVIWRDALREISDVMVINSEKWGDLTTLTWVEYLKLINSDTPKGELLKHYSKEITGFLTNLSPRLILFGIYLIDLIQDTNLLKVKLEASQNGRTDLELHPIRNLESNRTILLGKLSELRMELKGQFSIYSRNHDNGTNDWETMDLENGIVPRNNRSELYKKATDPIVASLNK